MGQLGLNGCLIDFEGLVIKVVGFGLIYFGCVGEIDGETEDLPPLSELVYIMFQINEYVVNKKMME